MKLVVVGKNSFIARHIVAAAGIEGLDVTAITHGELRPAALAGAGWIVNCAMPPAMKDQPWRVENDFDLRVASLATQANAGFTMLSSRRVYPAEVRWDAREDGAASGDETQYGVNKARSEAAVRGSGARHAIFRLSNVFGAELGRASFLGRVLTSLKDRGEVHFDMAPQTRRDFIPVETVASVIARQVRQGAEGVFNLGAGFALPCGDIASWVMESHGGGRLTVSDDTVRDEFFLNMDRTAAALAARVTPDEIRKRCSELGENLRG